MTDCCIPLGRQHAILNIRCLLVPSPSTELCICDEISILENLSMFVRSVSQYFARIVAQYRYQAIAIYTRFSTKVDISLFAIYRSLRTINPIFTCLWMFKNSISYFCLLVEVLTLFRSLQIRSEVQQFIMYYLIYEEECFCEYFK